MTPRETAERIVAAQAGDTETVRLIEAALSDATESGRIALQVESDINRAIARDRDGWKMRYDSALHALYEGAQRNLARQAKIAEYRQWLRVRESSGDDFAGVVTFTYSQARIELDRIMEGQ